MPPKPGSGGFKARMGLLSTGHWAIFYLHPVQESPLKGRAKGNPKRRSAAAQVLQGLKKHRALKNHQKTLPLGKLCFHWFPVRMPPGTLEHAALVCFWESSVASGFRLAASYTLQKYSSFVLWKRTLHQLH